MLYWWLRFSVPIILCRLDRSVVWRGICPCIYLCKSVINVRYSDALINHGAHISLNYISEHKYWILCQVGIIETEGFSRFLQFCAQWRHREKSWCYNYKTIPTRIQALFVDVLLCAIFSSWPRHLSGHDLVLHVSLFSHSLYF